MSVRPPLSWLFIKHNPKSSLGDPVAIGQESRHLFRALIRECRFLPDKQARRWMPQWIRFRYRRGVQDGKRERSDRERRIAKQLAEARQNLRRLRWANQGERTALTKVLMMSYGRTGKRKHDLIRALLDAPGPMGDIASDDSKQSMRLVKEQSHFPSPAPSRQFLTLVDNQKATAALPTFHTRALKNVTLDLEAQTIWKTPLPACRVKNMKAKYRMQVMGAVMPPLPSGEWENLAGLVKGTTACSIPERPLRKDWDPVEEDKFRSWGQHVITQKFMRRILLRIWELCPLMQWEAEEKRWQVTWGKLAKPTIRAAAWQSSDFIFEPQEAS